MNDFFILIKISLEFVPGGPINNNSALAKLIAWHRIGDKWSELNEFMPSAG